MSQNTNMNEVVGNYDILFITLNSLRYDVATDLYENGSTPHIASILPETGWEKRHTPASFTYAAHHAFFTGFLPTPADDSRAKRLFAARFAPSQTIAKQTFAFDTDNIVEALARKNYRTICIGGVTFFNKTTPLSRVFTEWFKESYWTREMSPAEPKSANYQFAKAAELLASSHSTQRVFTFINVSALHAPTTFYLEGAREETKNTQAAALRYVDSQFPILIDAVRKRGKTFCILCADHGTALGEEGYHGHRAGHSSIWDVPYAHFFID